MIEHPLTDSIDHLDSHLSQELSQYRRVNFNLRRKLKEKDLKIWSLLEMIGETGKQSQLTPAPPKKKFTHQRGNSLKMSWSENKKQKQNKNALNHEQQKYNLLQQSIFTDESALFFRKDPLRLKLPTVESKPKQHNSSQGADNGRKKLVKIALQKLKPLDKSEVKRRFMMKYRVQPQIEQ